MKFRTLILTAAVLATASGYAFAQTPTERTGSKADNPITQSGKDTMHKDKMKSGTTGSGASNNDVSGKSNSPTSNPTVSPASPNAGEKQVK